MSLVPTRSSRPAPWSPEVMPTTGALWPTLDLFNPGPNQQIGSVRLLLDMYETPTHVMVDLALPGVKPEELDVQVEGLTLTIQGQYAANQDQSTTYWYKNLPDGGFLYRLTLPVKVSPTDVEADLKRGLLHLSFLKAPEAQTRRIEIKGAGASSSHH